MRLAGGSIIHEEFHSDAYSKSGGSLVMNSQAEIAKAIRDFNSGKLGRMG